MPRPKIAVIPTPPAKAQRTIVHTAAGPKRPGLQLAATVGDQRQQRVAIERRAALGEVGLDQAGGEHGEIVVVAEQVREPARLIRHRLQGAGPRVAQQPLVIPEILYPLAPLVQMLVRRIALDRAERRAPARIGPHRAGGQRRRVAALKTPSVDARPGWGLEGCDAATDGVLRAAT